MRQHKIFYPGSKNHYTTVKQDDFEYVEPINHTLNSVKKALQFLFKQQYEFDGLTPLQIEIITDFESKKYINEMFSSGFPNELLGLLGNKKKEQVKILKNMSLNSDTLFTFICYACKNYGFKYSHYSSQDYLPKGIQSEDLPELGGLNENGEVISIGTTSLLKGQIKTLINQRRSIVAKFIDKDSEWHCFFFTYKGLNGQEADEPPHIHYISNSFGYSRIEVLNQLKSKKYNLGSLPHINFERHPFK